MSDRIDDTRMPLTSDSILAERIDALRGLFPEAFTEGSIDFAKLKQALGDFTDDSPERYGLSWAGKSEAIRAVQSLSSGTLVPCKEESVNFDTTENLIIEGDNLEVLKLLQKSYYGKVKMIYIDPPYNTGNEFIYPDNFREGLEDYLKYSGQVGDDGARAETNTEASGRFHSKWLSMMYPRLFLARNLLADSGLIFVSIDDNEAQGLKFLLDEVFGAENFVESFVWKKSYGGGAKERYAVTQHEYVLAYARDIEAIADLWLPPDPNAEERYYRYRDDNYEARGPYRLKPLEATKSMDRRDNLVYAIPIPGGGELWPKRQWWWGKIRAFAALASNELVFTKNSAGEVSVSYKQYLKSESGEIRGAKPFSILDGFYTQQGTEDIRSLFDGQIPLQFPKPVALLGRLLQVGTSSEEAEIVVDFFAGSGTTAHAVLDLNKQDGGSRKFILVQLPEPTGNSELPTIADICKERLRRVIKKLDDESNGKLDVVNGNGQDRGFKVLKLTSSNFKLWNADEAPKDADALAEQLRLYADHIIPGRSQDDILYELLLKAGLSLTAKIEEREVHGRKVFSVADGLLLICMEDEITHETLRGIMELKPEMVLCLDNAFKGNDQLKTNIVLEMESHEIKFHTV